MADCDCAGMLLLYVVNIQTLSLLQKTCIIVDEQFFVI